MKSEKILPEQLKQRKEDTEKNFNERSIVNEDNTRSIQQVRRFILSKTIFRFLFS